MRYINTLHEGETIRNVYLCKGKRSAETRNGRPYDNLILQDKTGTLDGKVWDPNSGGIADYDELDFIEVYGEIISYNNNLQMNIKQIRKVQEGEYIAADYMPTTEKSTDGMYEELLGYIKKVDNQYLRQVLDYYFIKDETFIRNFKGHSAAKTVHHGFAGGLLEHTLSVVKFCDYMAGAYPILNKDLLFTAAICHDIGKTKELYIFEQLVANLMKVTNQTGTWVPLYVMTSEINDSMTREFFEEHGYFGYDKDYVKFFVQEMVPAVDFDGNLLMKSEDSLAMSPNGNGGWFKSLINAGLDKDLKDKGVEWLNVFGVDNVLQQIADPVFVGAIIESGCVSGSKVVRKCDPYERVGAMCLENGKPSIVEYYELTPEMAEAKNENGSLQYGFGVILNYLFRVDKLMAIAEKSLPIHVVEKKVPYIDENGTEHKPETPNAYKFETLILDMVYMMDNSLPFEVDREKEFAPVKNATGTDSVETARALLEKNGIEI